MINVHVAAVPQSAQSAPVVRHSGMVTFWVLFATLSLVLIVLLGIAISSIPATIPLTQRNHSGELRDLTYNTPAQDASLQSASAAMFR